MPEEFDDALWRNLEETGLSRLTSSQEAGPAEAAIVLSGLARHAAAVPIAETDLLAALARGRRPGSMCPTDGPLTIAIADADVVDGRITGTATDVPWPRSATVRAGRTHRRRASRRGRRRPDVADGHNLAGEPRGSFAFDAARRPVRPAGRGRRR